MKTQLELPIRLLLCDFLELAAKDVLFVEPKACPKNEFEEAKRTAEAFFDTKVYRTICDALQLPHECIREYVLKNKNSISREEEDTFSLNELSEV